MPREREVDIDAQDFRECTPLMVALERGERELVELLLQQGADPNLPDKEKRTPLHWICRDRDLDWARWFFEICAEKSLRVAIDDADKEGCTPLIVALKLRKWQLAEFLLCMGANTDLSNEEGATASALHTVCHYRDDDEAFEAAKMLFAARERLGLPPPLIDAPDKRGNRPLHLAAMRDRTKLVDYLLLGRGASAILANSAGRTFLHLIGRGQGNVDAARRLFELHGGEGRALLPEVVDAQDAAKDTPLHLAARNRNLEAIELLLRYGADPNAANARGLTPLHEILLERFGDFDFDDDDDDDYDYVMKDDDDMIDDDTQCLAEKFIEIVEKVKKTVQVNVQDENGDAPLHLALRRGKKKAAELLLSRGANPNLANATGETAMFLVCNRPTPNEAAALELAATVFEFSQERFKPLQLNVRDRNGLTALHCPLGRGEKRLVRLLLDGGIDPNQATKSGNALHHAVFHNCDVDMVRLMLERCQARNLPLDINARDSEGSTPLLMALLGNMDELFQFLLRSGADPNKANYQGETCVHHACKYDHRPKFCERARALFAICAKINQPVRIDAEDNEGRTPLQWAVARHSPTMVDLLVDRGADLSSFLFPTRSYLNASSREARCAEKKFSLAAGTLATLERLQARGYELDRADVLEIKKFFIDWHLLEDSPDREYKWYDDDEEFATAAKQMKISSSASLYDLIKTPVNDERLQRKSMEFYEFALKLDWLKLPDRLWDVCARHLCQRLPRTFFEQWSG